VQSVTLYTADATVADITALGKIEYLPLTKLPVPKVHHPFRALPSFHPVAVLLPCDTAR